MTRDIVMDMRAYMELVSAGETDVSLGDGDSAHFLESEFDELELIALSTGEPIQTSIGTLRVEVPPTDVPPGATASA